MIYVSARNESLAFKIQAPLKEGLKLLYDIRETQHQGVILRSYFQLFIHLVWATYKRKEMIDNDFAFHIEKLSKDKIEENKCKLIAFGCTADHIHLLVSLHPSVSISSLVSEVKGFTSFVIANKVNPGCGFRWQRGYGAFTVSNSDLERLKNYIKNQKKHHDIDNSVDILEI